MAAAPAGAVVLIRQGSYPQLTVNRRAWSRPVVFAPFPHERVTLPSGFDIEYSRGVTLRSLRVTDTSGESLVLASQNISIKGSNFTGTGMIIRADRRIAITGNVIHDLSRGAASDGFAGYGIWANGYLNGGSGDGLDHLTIAHNVFRGIPQDAIQVGGGHDRVSNVLIEGNDFGPVRRAIQTDHPDPIQIIGGRTVTIRSNYFHDSEDAIIVKDDVTTGLVVSNNLMVGWPGGCIQAQFWNTPGARVTNNTIWKSACLGLRFATDPSVGPDPRGLVVMRNIVDSYSLPDSRWVADQDDNVILKGPRLGRHDTARTPQLTSTFGVTGWARRAGLGASVSAADWR